MHVDKDVDRGFGLPLGKVDFGGNSCSELYFCHVFGSTDPV